MGDGQSHRSIGQLHFDRPLLVVNYGCIKDHKVHRREKTRSTNTIIIDSEGDNHFSVSFDNEPGGVFQCVQEGGGKQNRKEEWKLTPGQACSWSGWLADSLRCRRETTAQKTKKDVKCSRWLPPSALVAFMEIFYYHLPPQTTAWLLQRGG